MFRRVTPPATHEARYKALLAEAQRLARPRRWPFRTRTREQVLAALNAKRAALGHGDHHDIEQELLAAEKWHG